MTARTGALAMSRNSGVTFLVLLAGLLAARSAFASVAMPQFASPPLIVPVGVTPHAIAVGDFDGNDRPDLAVANRSGGTISVLLQTIEHSFVVTQVISPNQPYSVAAGDLNGDGHLDLVAANFGAPNVAVHLGSGTGTFTPYVLYPSNATTISVVIRDMDADGRSDVVTGNFGSASVSFFRGMGDGTLGARRDIPTGDRVWAVAVGDLDRDGALDILSANEGSSTVSFVRGLGGGQFASALNTAVGPSPRGIAIADLEPDGDLDVVAQNGDGTVTVLRGAGDGSLAAGPALGQGGLAFGVAVGDVNGDGRPDIASVQGGLQSLSFLLGDAGDQFEFWPGVSTGDSPRAVAIADLDGASGPEVMIANAGANTVTILFSRTVLFPQPSTISLRQTPNLTFYGQEFELRASVRPDTAQGTVEFRNGTSPIGSAQVLTGVASLRVSSLQAGSRVLSAAFSGNSFVSASTSTEITHEVLLAPITVSLVSAPNPSEQHQPATFSVSVMPTLLSLAIPAGVVRLSVDGVEVGPETSRPLEDGLMTLSLNTLSSRRSLHRGFL